MNEKTASTLRRIFKEYYFKHLEEIEIPSRMSEREFGYMTFESVMIRHLSFNTPEDLRVHILKEAPHSVYYSTSFYAEPSKPMHEKGLKGGELVFDIDADELSSPCREKHDKWLCRECGRQETGVRPNKCPSCKGTRLHEVNIACNVCLDAAKQEALKLLDILVEDFGIKRTSLAVYFSGSMGYHISVSDPVFEEADQAVRSEIVDYVSGQGFIPESLGVSSQSTYENLVERLPSETARGWRGRIARHFKTVEEGGEDSGGAKTRMIELYRRSGYKKFRIAVQNAAKKSGATVDPSVTTDIHRIFRLPGTLHGKTGLLKKKCRDIEQFNPLVDAVALGRTPMNIYVDYAPQFTLAGEEFGPFKSESVELPTVAAVYLMGLNMAEAEDRGDATRRPS